MKPISIENIIPENWLRTIENECPAIGEFEIEVNEKAKLCYISFYVDNPYGEDHREELSIPFGKKAKMKDAFVEGIQEVWNRYDIEEEVTLWLEAKNNGFSGVPNVVNLVENCQAIDKNLENLACLVEKLDTEAA